MLFLESPWPILILGLVLETFLAMALFNSRRGVLLWAMAGVALLVVVGVFIEQSTPTDTKRIRQALDAAATGLVADNAAQVDALIVPGPDGDRARELVRWALSQAKFLELNVGNPEVKLNYRTSPPTAETSFTVSVRGLDRSGTVPGEISRPVAMEVALRKESGRWLIFGEPKHDVRE